MSYLKIIATAAIVATIAPAEAQQFDNALQTLPANVQKAIKATRDSCPAEKTTSGDEGLHVFGVSGLDAVLVDELALCGGECFKGNNCATGYTHNVTIYVGSGNALKKVFSVEATEPIFVSTEPYTGKFRALVLSVHAGWDLGCPVRNKNDPTAWKREKCDFVIRWDGSRFVHKPL
jgi:hypothetical protein